MSEHWNELKNALTNDDQKAADELLEKGPPSLETINEKDSVGWMLLHEVAMRGKTKLVELFIKAGADINARTKKGATPLHYAAYQGQIAVVKLLVSKGADVNATDNGGDTPLRWAEMLGHEEIVTFLRSQGAQG
jgi:ankyrin repeat protein